MSGGVDNLILKNNTIVAGGLALTFKSNLDRGAWITDVVVEGLQAGKVKGCIDFTNNYHGGRGGDFPTRFQNFTITDVECNEVTHTALSIEGLAEQPIENVTMRNVVVRQAMKASQFENTKDFVFRGVKVNGKTVDAPTVTCMHG